jgi:hypothetical protein
LAEKRRQPRGSNGLHAAEVGQPDGDGPDDEKPGGAPQPTLSAEAFRALSELSSEGVVLPDEPVVQLGAEISDEDRDRLIAAAMAQVEMQEAIYRVSTTPRRGVGGKAAVAFTLLFLALLVGVWPPGIMVPDPPAQLTQRDVLTGLRVTLLLQAQQIEAFRVTEDRLPTSLEEAGAPFDGIRYVRSGNRVYQLVAYAPDGEPVIFDSAAPAPAFEALVRIWLPAGRGA